MYIPFDKIGRTNVVYSMFNVVVINKFVQLSTIIWELIYIFLYFIFSVAKPLDNAFLSQLVGTSIGSIIFVWPNCPFVGHCVVEDVDSADDSPIDINKYEVPQLHSCMFIWSCYL